MGVKDEKGAIKILNGIHDSGLGPGNMIANDDMGTYVLIPKNAVAIRTSNDGVYFVDRETLLDDAKTWLQEREDNE
jgi:hypothetical protein